MLKKIFIIFSVCFFITLSIVFIYRKEILDYIADKETKANIGEKIQNSFEVIDLQGKKSEFAKIYKKPLVVLVYSDSCPPCKDSVKAISKYIEDTNSEEIKRDFVVLLFDEKKSSFLESFEKIKYFRTEIPKKNTIFNGWITPTFYLFDLNGKLESKITGWHPISFVDMFKD